MQSVLKNKNLNSLIFPFFFFIIFIFSYVIFGILNSTSYASSTFFVIAIIVFVSFVSNYGNILKLDRIYFLIIIGFMVLLALHSSITSILNIEVNNARVFFSLMLLSLMLLSSPLIFNIFELVEEDIFKKTIILSYYFLLLFGFIMVIIHKNHIILTKDMILFKEPSHFAMVLLPLSLFYMILNNGKKRYVNYVLLLLLSLLLENLTLLAGVLTILIIINWKYKYKLILILCCVIFLTNFLDFAFLNYYTDRLVLTSSSDNLSVLVFISGWERALFSFLNTNGLGIGFQNLGFFGNYGVAMMKIGYILNGRFINLYDGGSLAPKLIAELGFFGFFAILSYLGLSFRMIVNLGSIKKRENSKYVFFISIFLMFIIQLFIRGIGYFSPMSLFFIASVYMLFKKKRKF